MKTHHQSQGLGIMIRKLLQPNKSTQHFKSLNLSATINSVVNPLSFLPSDSRLQTSTSRHLKPFKRNPSGDEESLNWSNGPKMSSRQLRMLLLKRYKNNNKHQAPHVCSVVAASRLWRPQWTFCPVQIPLMSTTDRRSAKVTGCSAKQVFH